MLEINKSIHSNSSKNSEQQNISMNHSDMNILIDSNITHQELSQYLEILEDSSQQEIENAQDLFKTKQSSDRTFEQMPQKAFDNYGSNKRFSTKTGFYEQEYQKLQSQNEFLQQCEEYQRQQKYKIQRMKIEEMERERIQFKQRQFKINENSQKILQKKYSKQQINRSLTASCVEIHKEKLLRIEQMRMKQMIQENNQAINSLIQIPKMDNYSQQIVQRYDSQAYQENQQQRSTYRRYETKREEINLLLQQCTFSPQINHRSLSIVRDVKSQNKLRDNQQLNQYIKNQKTIRSLQKIQDSLPTFHPQYFSNNNNQTQGFINGDAIDEIYHQLVYKSNNQIQKSQISQITQNQNNKKFHSEQSKIYIKNNYNSEIKLFQEKQNDYQSYKQIDELDSQPITPKRKLRGYDTNFSNDNKSTNYHTGEYNSEKFPETPNHLKNSFNSKQIPIIQEENDQHQIKSVSERNSVFLQKNLNEFKNLLQGINMKSDKNNKISQK